MGRKRKTLLDDIEAAADANAMRRKNQGSHTHLAELYGDSQTHRLTRWARRSVLTAQPR